MSNLQDQLAYAMPAVDNAAFSSLLHMAEDDIFTLDLSNYNLVQCIQKMCDVKKVSHPHMLKNYSMAICQINKLQEEFDCIVKPIRINSIFWEMFISWMAQKGIKYSSINTAKSQILSVLNWAAKYNVKLQPSYDEVDVPRYRTTKVALTPDEVSHIYHIDLTHEFVYNKKLGRKIRMRSDKVETLTRVKDQFVLACNLGQRYSDMVRIKPEYFDNGVFSMIQQKTGNRCKVDISKMCIDKRTVYAILDKYDYTAPYPYDISNYNKYLKELLQIVGGSFEEEITIENKINGIICTEKRKKYTMIGSHTARRTFATYNELRGVSRHDTMKATGHSTEQSFIAYICDDEI